MRRAPFHPSEISDVLSTQAEASGQDSRQAQAEAEAIIPLYRDLFTSPAGEQVLEHLRKHFMKGPASAPIDPAFLNYSEAQRYVIHFIDTMTNGRLES